MAVSEALLGARMADGATPQAIFPAFELDVLSIERVAQLRTNVSARHFRFAFLETSAFRWELFLLIGSDDISVDLTFQWKMSSNFIILF